MFLRNPADWNSTILILSTKFDCCSRDFRSHCGLHFELILPIIPPWSRTCQSVIRFPMREVALGQVILNRQVEAVLFPFVCTMSQWTAGCLWSWSWVRLFYSSRKIFDLRCLVHACILLVWLFIVQLLQCCLQIHLFCFYDVRRYSSLFRLCSLVFFASWDCESVLSLFWTPLLPLTPNFMTAFSILHQQPFDPSTLDFSFSQQVSYDSEVLL